jgi:hypothetical protein
MVPREGLEPSRPRGAPRFERSVSSNSIHLGLVDPEGVEPSHHDGPQFLRLGCLPVPSRIESAGRGTRTPTRTVAHHILSVGCLPFHHPGMSLPALVARGCVSSVRRESNPQRPRRSSSTSSWRVCRSTTDREECGAEGSNLSPCEPRIYSPPAGTTRYHTARCRAQVLRFNSEGATATGVGGSGTWCRVPTQRALPP